MQETWAQSLGWEDPLKKEMATHCSIIAWKISWTEEPGGVQSMGSQSRTTERLTRKVLCDLGSKSLAVSLHWRCENKYF